MNIDKAKEYAEGKVTDALNKLVADAYIAGYNAGYQDGVDKVAKETVSEETEYVDLGLPSGTLWASDYVKEGDDVLFLPYPEALKYNIPSEEQVKELEECCKFDIEYDDDNKTYIVLGPNGNTIMFEETGYMRFQGLRSLGAAYFWQVYKSDNPKEIEVPKIFRNNYGVATICSNTLFPGYKVPIRTVKAK